MLYIIIRGLLKLIFKLFFHLNVYGVENVPRVGGLIVAPNHRSFLDIPVVGTALPRKMHTLGKKELIADGKGAWLYKTLGGIPIDRDGADLKAMRVAKNLLEQNNSLLMFPEGTRSLTKEIGDVKKGVVFLSYRAHVPIVPVGIAGTGKALPKSAKLLKISHLVVTFGKPIKLWELFDSKNDSFYNDAALYLREEIKKCVRTAEEKL